MLKAIRKRMEDREEGFTLIELMVVVLIIAILIAIAIPTFLGARSRAQNRAAQSNLRNEFTAEKTYYTDAQAYTQVASDLTAIEPSITPDGATLVPAGTNHVALLLGASNQEICLVAKSASGNFYGIRDLAQGAGAGTYYYNVGTTQPTACTSAGGFSDTSFK